MKTQTVLKLCVQCIGLAVALTLAGCGTSPLAEMNELKAFRGNVEQPWKVGLAQQFAGSSNLIDTKSQSLRVTDREPVRVFVRSAVVEPAVVRNTSAYDAQAAQAELARQVQSSAIRWGRFQTVPSINDADLVIDVRMSMLAIEGDTLKTDEEIASSYTGMFGSRLSASEALSNAREIMRTQITLDYTNQRMSPPRGIASSQVTCFYAKGRGELLTKAAQDALVYKRAGTFDGGKLQPYHLPLLLGEAVDAAFIDSFRTLDGSLWLAEAAAAGQIRRSTLTTAEAADDLPR